MFTVLPRNIEEKAKITCCVKFFFVLFHGFRANNMQRKNCKQKEFKNGMSEFLASEHLRNTKISKACFPECHHETTAGNILATSNRKSILMDSVDYKKCRFIMDKKIHSLRHRRNGGGHWSTCPPPRLPRIKAKHDW